MSVNAIAAKKIAADLRFDFNDSCNCSKFCCYSVDPNKIVYINHEGMIEKYNKSKAIGGEHAKSARRIENLIKLRLKTHTNEVEKYLMEVQGKSRFSFSFFSQGDTAITMEHMQEINRVLEEIAIELAAIRTPSSTSL